MEKDYNNVFTGEFVKVGLDIDTAEQIAKKVIEQQFWDLSSHIGGCPMFSMDEDENQRLTDELRDAFIKVLEYNGVYIVKKGGKYVRRSK